MPLNKDTKEIWVFPGAVTNLECYNGQATLGQREWQFSDGPDGTQSCSEDFLDLAEGLKEYSGYTIHMEQPKRQPDPRLPYSLALLEVRIVLEEAMKNYEADPAQTIGAHVHEILNQLHQENETKIDADQTRYLIDRGWASLTEDGWWNVPAHINGETLYYGHANAMELQEWFG